MCLHVYFLYVTFSLARRRHDSGRISFDVMSWHELRWKLLLKFVVGLGTAKTTETLNRGLCFIWISWFRCAWMSVCSDECWHLWNSYIFELFLQHNLHMHWLIEYWTNYVLYDSLYRDLNVIPNSFSKRCNQLTIHYIIIDEQLTELKINFSKFSCISQQFLNQNLRWNNQNSLKFEFCL